MLRNEETATGFVNLKNEPRSSGLSKNEASDTQHSVEEHRSRSRTSPSATEQSKPTGESKSLIECSKEGKKKPFDSWYSKSYNLSHSPKFSYEDSDVFQKHSPPSSVCLHRTIIVPGDLSSPQQRIDSAFSRTNECVDAIDMHSAPSVFSVNLEMQDLQRCLNTVSDVLLIMETHVAGPIYSYLPIMGQKDDTLLMMAMDIERSLDMLEYVHVQKHENIAMKIINDLKHLLQSILPVLENFREHLVSLTRVASVQNSGNLTRLRIMPNIENIREQPASTSVEKQNPSIVKETVVAHLLEEGQDGIFLVPFLLSSVSEDSVISIQNIYKNSRVKGHFDMRIWVNVSGRSTMISSKVAVKRCINELMNAHVMSSENQSPPVHSTEFSNWIMQNGISGSIKKTHDQKMKDLEKVIQCGLSGKKFLLVLHGISEDQMAQWEHLFRAIKSGKKGSKVIVLTTSTNVEESVRNINILRSDEIENELYWYFFRSYAFDSFRVDDYQTELSIQMATLLRLFPVAIKMIGCMLKNNPDKKFWSCVYHNIFQIVVNGKEADDHYQLLSLLKLCYDQLPAPVGLCFSYCSLYPKGWRFTAQSLIHIWMSEGISEDIGRSYFYFLYSRGYFELLKLRGRPSPTCYVMHSAIHRLAEVVSAKMFRRVDSDYLPTNPQLMAHVSIMSGFLPTLWMFRWRIPELHLRTLILFGPSEHTALSSREILDEILERQKYIRVLDFTGCVMQKLPKLSNESTHHLRYLCLRDTGNLTNLQELQEYRVRKLAGYGIQELRHMNLSGSLSIKNLENVTLAAKANKVNLSSKTCLDSLRLEWHSTKEISQSVSAEVLEQLQPPNSINELEINGYPSIISPTWFNENHLRNVKKVTLRNCSFISVVAPLAKLPSLEMLTLESFSMLKRMTESDRLQYFQYALRLLKFSTDISCRFPRLVKLYIEDMPLLEEWTEQQPCFPCLEELTVRNCPKLAVLPQFHHSRVTKMQIEGLHLKSFAVSSGEFLDGAAMQPPKAFILRHCPVLSTFTILDVGSSSTSSHCLEPLLQLEITDCKELKAIEGAFAFVEKLHIQQCHSSLKLPNGNAMQSLHTLHIDSVSTRNDPFLLGLQALRVLIITDSAELRSLDVLLASDQLSKTLEQLQLINCNNIESLPRNMDQFLAFVSLYLINCSNMRSLPCLPNNLTELRISGCPILKEKYCHYGPEWDDISHVPYVSVD
ncbi:putative disease resistance protein RGA1 [Oryza glaberrima]|uniref:putative disease resistance protein RGA1 n=1 Tax=Oryza glaberrima TaxID=4538 RepID=UPI00224C49CD|nr:putative disease resistance protein RGA1 [Oryza glaberrima]